MTKRLDFFTKIETIEKVSTYILLIVSLFLVILFFLLKCNTSLVTLNIKTYADHTLNQIALSDLTFDNLDLFFKYNLPRYDLLYTSVQNNELIYFCDAHNRILDGLIFLIGCASNILVLVYLYFLTLYLRLKQTEEVNGSSFKFIYVAIPLIFALYPAFSTYFINYSELSFLDVLYFSLILSVISIAIFFLIQRLLKNYSQTCIILSLFFCYLYLYKIAFTSWIYIEFFIFLYNLISVFLLSIILKMKNQNIVFKITKFIAIILLIFLLVDGSKVLFEKVKENIYKKNKGQPRVEALVDNNILLDKKDVYIIILDSYPNKQVLKRSFGFDNSEFINNLQNNGFYVADEVYSNYTKTISSIPSFMNFNYVDELDFETSSEALMESQLIKMVARLGYEITYINHGFTFDQYTSDNTKITKFVDLIDSDLAFAKLILQKMLIYKYLEAYLSSNEADKFKKFSSAVSATIDQSNTPKLVIGHLLSPHFPYLVDEHGTSYKSPSQHNDNLLGGAEYRINKESCLGFLKYTNGLIEDLVADILKHSKKEPVIILVGDHGLRLHYYFVEENAQKDTLFMDKETINSHFNTFFAIYKPDKKYENYKNEKTLINLFIEFSNDIFKTNYTKKPDKFYYIFMSQHGDKFQEIFENTIEITDIFPKYKYE